MFTLGAHEFIVGLGSNSDHALDRLRSAREALRREFILLATSPLYESDALLPTGAPESWNRPFLNAACRLKLRNGWPKARSILEVLKRLERDLGRKDAPRWAPRPIDLDLLAWDGPNITEPQLKVPHAGLDSRPFAFLPAQDCAPESPQNRAPHPWRYSHPEEVPQRTRRSTLSWPALVGIVNLTPDSFSDGRPPPTGPELETQIRALVANGACVLDLGAESTRPGAAPLTSHDEISRLEPHWALIQNLRQELGFRLSLDTRHAKTATWAIERGNGSHSGLPSGIDWLNDVGGLSDPKMRAVAAQAACDVVVMHSLGVPPRREATLDPARDPLRAIMEWGQERLDTLASDGIPATRVILDPGLGFGKTSAQHFALVARASELQALPARILIGHSRKRFLSAPLLEGTLSPTARDLESAVITAQLASVGPDYLRVHDPASQSRALALGARL